MTKTRPDFIIIGAMKSATSTLHEQLALQPGIFMSRPKEPNYFSDDNQYGRGHDWYASLFIKANPQDFCGESSTHYTKLPTYPKTIERMRECVPDVKLIYVVRNPIDRLLSHYVHEWTQRVISEPPEQAVKRHPELISYSLYSLQLRPYLEHFGPDRVLLVFFDSLTNNPQPEFERICQFIGYSGMPVWQNNQPPQNVSRDRLRTNPWHNLMIEQPVLRAMRRSLVPKAFREFVKKFLRMESKPYLSEAMVDRLKATFDEDLNILSSWVGFPITCDTWKKVAATHFPEIHAKMVI